MFFQRIYDKNLAHASYMIGCQATGEALVVDAQRDVDGYIKLAKANRLQITHITETHIHADFLCGSRELAALTGAQLLLSDEGGEDWSYQFPHQGLKDGSQFMIGKIKVDVLHTPGHTPESISFLITDTPASEKPLMILTGDFVFVGDVGRPDLLEKAAGIVGSQETGARQMYASLQRFTKLSDYIQVWPAHGAGSACGKALGAVPSSTVGYEKLQNWALQFGNNQKEFMDELLEGQPEPPKYFARMKQLNRVDRPLLLEVPKPKKLSPEEFRQEMARGATIIDTRPKTEFAQGFIPGVIHIQNNAAFTTWAGWFVDEKEPLVLIAPEGQIEELCRKLMRIGLDTIIGFVPGIEDLGMETEKVNQINHDELLRLVSTQEAQILDVRSAKEFKAHQIPGATHLFLGTITDHFHLIDSSRPKVIHCQAGDRSSTAYSLLRKYGIQGVSNYGGGMKEWKEKEGLAAAQN